MKKETNKRDVNNKINNSYFQEYLVFQPSLPKKQTPFVSGTLIMAE